jgi:protein CpxP
MRLTIRSAALSAIIVLGAASAALAQPPAQHDPRGERPAAGQMQARMQAMREAHQRQRAQDLRTILRLRPEQEPALTAFLQSHKAPMPPPDHGRPPGDEAALTTPQRLDEMARREARHAAMGQHNADALRAFYGALSPEQRQVFDALQRMQHGGHGHGDPEHGGPEHGGWGHRGFGGPAPGGPAPGGPPPRD